MGGGVSQALGDESFVNANDFLLDGNGVSTWAIVICDCYRIPSPIWSTVVWRSAGKTPPLTIPTLRGTYKVPIACIRTYAMSQPMGYILQTRPDFHQNESTSHGIETPSSQSLQLLFFCVCLRLIPQQANTTEETNNPNCTCCMKPLH